MIYAIPLRTTLGKCLFELGIKEFLRNQGRICMNPYPKNQTNASLIP
ncbi:MAG: hypothetical protein RIS64_2437 [Bacteroidota bacterium]|jgi:hypothetical protein